MSNHKTLMELIDTAEQIARELLDHGGEVTPAIDALLDMTSVQLKEKLDAYGVVLDTLKSRQAYANARIQEWAKIATACDKSIDHLKTRLQGAMVRMDMPEAHGYEYTWKLVANPPSVIIDDEAIIPGEFITTETKVLNKVDKRSISEKLKTGETVPGAHLERSIKLVNKVSQRKDIKPGPTLEQII